MTYSQQVQNMCPITKGPKHGPAPIPEEGAWVKAYEVKDICNEEAVDFDIYKVELADNTTDTMGSHGNYVLIYVKGQIRTPDYSGGEDPYEYIDAYFCFVFCDAVITRTGEFTMAVNDIEQR